MKDVEKHIAESGYVPPTSPTIVVVTPGISTDASVNPSIDLDTSKDVESSSSSSS